MLGDRILQTDKRISETTPDVAFQMFERTIRTPRRAGLSWPSDLREYAHDTPGGAASLLLPIRVLKIGRDTVVWGAPVELFCEIATEIRDNSPFLYTFYFGMLNGTLGYLPTAEAIREQGYEPSVSPFTEQAESDLREGVITALQALPQSQSR
jgi:hypothetical protein